MLKNSIRRIVKSMKDQDLRYKEANSLDNSFICTLLQTVGFIIGLCTVIHNIESC